ncbi:MAG TPA: MspA family porin [Mycobacterium sp.]|nr:MspA family porin [Mycobacterium sp.]HPZ96458.1 MspA family porin [Mycobacterium sp.]HQE13980.1 MspA family porin [Mycobacterium sp.]
MAHTDRNVAGSLRALRRSVAALGIVLLVATAGAAPSSADPPADPSVAPVADAAPAGPGAPIASGAPGTLTTPDGWVLSVGATRESLEPVSSLTNAPWSREYIVDGTFIGTVTGAGSTALQGGTLEAGYQIGCGITQDGLESVSTIGVTPGISFPGLFPVFLGLNASQQLRISLRAGVVNIVPVGRTDFEGTTTRVSVTGYRISIDGCAGQSFIRSYATLTSSTDDTADMVTYLGVTRAV